MPFKVSFAFSVVAFDGGAAVGVLDGDAVLAAALFVLGSILGEAAEFVFDFANPGDGRAGNVAGGVDGPAWHGDAILGAGRA